MSTWTKLPPVPARTKGCLNCDAANPILQLAELDMVIAVGFGMACCTKDGAEVYSEPMNPSEDTDYKTVLDMEAKALLDPDHDWRITKSAALYDAEWQRQGLAEWVLVRTGEGFA